MKRVITYIFIGLAALSLSGCKDFLEKGPKLSQSSELTLSTYSGLDKVTQGVYAYFGSLGWYGGERVLESEMRSGNGMKNADHTSNRYNTEMNWNYLPESTSSMWALGYEAIAACNNVIDNLEGKESSEVSAQDLNNLKAECLFIRAFCHFDMVTLFALPYTYVKANEKTLNEKQKLGIPYVIHTDPAGTPARDPVLEVYPKVVEDLLAAEEAIDPSYARSGVADKKAVVTLEAIQALLSRVYLYMGEWQKAADYATKVIDSGKFELYTVENYEKVWNQNTGGSEVIFENYIDLGNYSNENPMYMCYPDGAYGDCICSAELYNSYADGDIRKKLYCQDKNETDGLWWTLKYKGKGLGNPDANNTVILRLSEMYLNRAEAIVNGASIPGTTAVKDLNEVITNRGLAGLNSVGMDAIKSERRKELAWEGHYFFDKARWGESVVRDLCYGMDPRYQNINFPDYRWALPIPKRELEVNANLKQNDGYKE